MLSHEDRKHLRQIERALSRDDPSLARMLRAPGDRPRTGWLAGAGALLIVAGLLGAGDVAVSVGVALTAVAVVCWLSAGTSVGRRGGGPTPT